MTMLKQTLLVEAAKAARTARARELQQNLCDPSERYFYERLLDHPFFLPLIELHMNGCTSLSGARALVDQGVIEIDEFRSVSPRFFGKHVECIRMTREGENELCEGISELSDSHHADNFFRAVTAYLCIDNGYGICYGRPLLEAATRLPDAALLERAVFVDSGVRQFKEQFLRQDYIDDAIRIAFAADLSPAGMTRISAEIVDLTE